VGLSQTAFRIGQENRVANRTAGAPLATEEVIPAGHVASTVEDELSDQPNTAIGVGGLSLAALGVVFGDIGTSPVYTFRECFNPEYGLPVDAEHVLGALSMIFWALIIVVAIKYVLWIMRADNRGEGGILALLALALESARGERSRSILILLALGGAALFYGYSMITPSISVLSAVEGLGIATPSLHRFIVPLTIAVLFALFLFQNSGSERVGRLFGPVMTLWFAVIAVMGALQISEAPRVLAALNPAHAVGIFVAAPMAGFLALGAVAAAITGGEALYADMGHFGRFPIRLAWFAVVLPALVLNYFGQGALLLGNREAIENPFFNMVPDSGLFPLVLLSTVATVIASQTVISGAFSVTRQAIQLGLVPLLDIFQTSARILG
jgi:KUP system potassium uptake protein